jgi:hypothetical protein
MLDQDYLKELFEYKDGELYWKVKFTNSINIGDIVGTKNNKYSKVGIERNRFYKHKIIFMIHHGYCPSTVDFIDGNPFNRKIENLRTATRSDSCCNSRKRSDNTSGYRGVSWDKTRNKWVSVITKNQKRMHLGYFECIKEAYKIYCNAAKKYHGEFAKLN